MSTRLITTVCFQKKADALQDHFLREALTSGDEARDQRRQECAPDPNQSVVTLCAQAQPQATAGCKSKRHSPKTVVGAGIELQQDGMGGLRHDEQA